MSTISVYFIPTAKFPVGKFRTLVKKALEKLKFIDGYYEKEEQLYAHGDAIEFEYASIQDSDKTRLVPEASSAGYGATCNNCYSDIDEVFYDVLNDFYDLEDETGKEKDMAELKLSCSNCEKETRFDELKFKTPVVLANHFFQFVDIDEEIPDSMLKRLEKELNSELKLIYERM